MPSVTVELRPNGLPTASTRSPTSNFSYSAHFSDGKSLASILTTAKSVFGSVPTTFAENSRRSLRVTVIWVAPSTTWLLVTMNPLESKMTPEPALWSGRPCGMGGPCGIGGGVGPSPPPGSSPGGGVPNGLGGTPPRLRLPSPPPVTAIFTTAGVVFFTMSEKPWAHAGGTPAADAGDTHPLPARAHTISPLPINTLVACWLQFAITEFLQDVTLIESTYRVVMVTSIASNWTLHITLLFQQASKRKSPHLSSCRAVAFILMFPVRWRTLRGPRREE